MSYCIVCLVHDTVWRDLRPLVTLLQIFGGRVAKFIDLFEITSGEGTAAYYVVLIGAFHVHGNRTGQDLSELLF